MGEGVGEIFFFFGVGVGVSSSTAGVRFFFGEEVGDGVGVSVGLADGEGFFFRRGDGVGDALGFFFTPAVGDGVVFGVGDGVGDFFFVALTVVFFRCGVGVGVAKIFLSAWPSVCSAPSLTGATTPMHRIRIRARRSM